MAQRQKRGHGVGYRHYASWVELQFILRRLPLDNAFLTLLVRCSQTVSKRRILGRNDAFTKISHYRCWLYRLAR